MGDDRVSAESSSAAIWRPSEEPRSASQTLSPISRPRLPTAPSTVGGYHPYAVDWRFLPEEVLFVKDYVRDVLVYISNELATSSQLSWLWSHTLGMNTISSVKSAKVLFIHVPKTGGTSISSVLYGKNLPHYTARFWREAFGDTITAFPSFAILRHPVERFVSAYKMAVFGGTDIIAYSRFLRSRLRGLESLERYAEFVFENRARLESLPVELHRQAGFILDEDGRVMVDRLFSLESGRGLPTALARWLAIKCIPHLNATPPLAVDMTARVRRRIEEVYARDLVIYEHVAAVGGVADLKGRRLPAL